VVTSGIPTTASESSATITVQPAKTTAPPEVARGGGDDGGGACFTVQLPAAAPAVLSEA
jgi:hypothetical protein